MPSALSIPQEVAGRIAGLIRQGLYLTEQEQAKYDRIQAEKVQGSSLPLRSRNLIPRIS